MIEIWLDKRNLKDVKVFINGEKVLITEISCDCEVEEIPGQLKESQAYLIAVFPKEVVKQYEVDGHKLFIHFKEEGKK